MKTLPALEWFVEAGVSDVTSETPTDYFSLSGKPAAAQVTAAPISAATSPKPTYTAAPMPKQLREEVPEFKAAAAPTSASLSAALAEARELADNAKTLEELRSAVSNFTGCALKKTANKTVFADGNPTTGVMVIGEAPGADEDREGIPFCGMSGQLLDKVLQSINLDRKSGFYITNTIFWRPPGNRKPTPEELAICEPFLEKHVALVAPKILLLVGATAVQAILKDPSSMGKLRGNIYHYKNRYMQHDVPVMVTYHPSFLLRSPLNKRLAWEDMLKLNEKLKEFGVK